MGAKKLVTTLSQVTWYDASYTDKDGRKVNPYPGVKWLISTRNLPPGKSEERVYYIVYRGRDGRQHREKVGRQWRDRMTPAKAAAIRETRIRGTELPNRARREKERAEREAAKAAADARWELNRLFDEYQRARGDYPRRVTDEGIWRVHLAPVVGSKTPSEVTPFDIDRIKHDMRKPRMVLVRSRVPGGKSRLVQKGNCKPGTIASALSFLERIANFGRKRGLDEGLRFRVEKPKVGTVRIEQMTPEQAAAYVKVAGECENRVVGAALQLALLTGMRQNEVRKLQWDAVDLDRGMVHIRSPKGGHDQFIPLNSAALALLEQLPRDPANPLFVFPGERGGPVGVSTLQRWGRKFAAAVGLPKDFRPCHGLRHAFASLLASSGQVDLYTLQKLLTHKSPTMTQRYAHLRDEALRRGAEVMARIAATAPPQADREKPGAVLVE